MAGGIGMLSYLLLPLRHSDFGQQRASTKNTFQLCLLTGPIVHFFHANPAPVTNAVWWSFRWNFRFVSHLLLTCLNLACLTN
jgi:hypothetical protein